MYVAIPLSPTVAVPLTMSFNAKLTVPPAKVNPSAVVTVALMVTSVPFSTT